MAELAPDASELRRFIEACPPFDMLSAEQLQWLLGQMRGVYLTRHNVDRLFQQFSPALYVVRSGSFDLLGPDGRLIERLESHDLFGYPSLLSGRPVVNRLQLLEDGIVYLLPAQAFNYLRQHNEAFERYFILAHGQRLLEEQGPRNSGAVRGADWGSSNLAQPLAAVLTRPPVCLSSQATIQQAAQLMRSERVSSLMITDTSGAGSTLLVGIVTDRDLRNRVVAEGLDYQLQVTAVMTQAPVTLQAQQTLLDAITAMSQHNIHHMPVVDEAQQPLGMITHTDLMRQQHSEPVLLINAINKAGDLEQLVQQAQTMPAYLRTFASRVSDTTIVGRLLAAFTDALTQRLISFYEGAHGVAPAPYVWLAFGSQGREDQTLSSDQDNGLLLADHLNTQQLAWFDGLGTYVCTGLQQCGIPLCPGNIMASNPDCRRTLSGWLERFTQWTEQPTPKALMYCQIFFDSRRVHGHKRLYQEFREQVAVLAQNDWFLAHLARLQSAVQVPLGLFNRFVGTEQGATSDYINIKRYGIALINDIVRIYALQAGLTMPQTLQRLAALRGDRLLNRRDNQALAEAWLFLTELRLQHQLAIHGSDAPANALHPDSLGPMARRQLKSAFRIIKDSQQAVALKFGRQG